MVIYHANLFAFRFAKYIVIGQFYHVLSDMIRLTNDDTPILPDRPVLEVLIILPRVALVHSGKCLGSV